jgi:hypothetical protein
MEMGIAGKAISADADTNKIELQIQALSAGQRVIVDVLVGMNNISNNGLAHLKDQESELAELSNKLPAETSGEIKTIDALIKFIKTETTAEAEYINKTAVKNNIEFNMKAYGQLLARLCILKKLGHDYDIAYQQFPCSKSNGLAIIKTITIDGESVFTANSIQLGGN